MFQKIEKKYLNCDSSPLYWMEGKHRNLIKSLKNGNSDAIYRPTAIK